MNDGMGLIGLGAVMVGLVWLGAIVMTIVKAMPTLADVLGYVENHPFLTLFVVVIIAYTIYDFCRKPASSSGRISHS